MGAQITNGLLAFANPVFGVALAQYGLLARLVYERPEDESERPVASGPWASTARGPTGKDTRELLHVLLSVSGLDA